VQRQRERLLQGVPQRPNTPFPPDAPAPPPGRSILSQKLLQPRRFNSFTASLTQDRTSSSSRPLNRASCQFRNRAVSHITCSPHSHSHSGWVRSGVCSTARPVARFFTRAIAPVLSLQEDENGERQEVWRPSENVIYDLGAAAISYDRRIVTLKEKRETFPSSFSDLGTWSSKLIKLAPKLPDSSAN
jgi:hypothetical protein